METAARKRRDRFLRDTMTKATITTITLATTNYYFELDRHVAKSLKSRHAKIPTFHLLVGVFCMKHLEAVSVKTDRVNFSVSLLG